MAGLTAAIESAAKGADVTVLDKLKEDLVYSGVRSTSPYGSGNETSRSGGGGLDRFSEELPAEDLVKRHTSKGWNRIEPA